MSWTPPFSNLHPSGAGYFTTPAGKGNAAGTGESMLKCWPSEARGLMERRTFRGPNPRRRQARAMWVLDIAGPFSRWPVPASHIHDSFQPRITAQMSTLFCCAVQCSIKDGVVTVTVLITGPDRDWLLRQKRG